MVVKRHRLFYGGILTKVDHFFGLQWMLLISGLICILQSFNFYFSSNEA